MQRHQTPQKARAVGVEKGDRCNLQELPSLLSKHFHTSASAPEVVGMSNPMQSHQWLVSLSTPPPTRTLVPLPGSQSVFGGGEAG